MKILLNIYILDNLMDTFDKIQTNIFNNKG